MTCWFITGTDTEIGKTATTATLAALLASRRHRVGIHKPAQTGMDSAQEEGDAAQAARLAGTQDGLVSASEGFRLRAPLAPCRAAALEGRSLPSLQEHAERVRELAAGVDDLIVEGSGGLLVELGEGFTIAELAREVALPGSQMVVTVRAGLGTLNHAGLTVEALRARGIVPATAPAGNADGAQEGAPALAGLVIGCWPAQADLASRWNLEDLPAVAPVLGRLPAGLMELPAAQLRAQAATWLPGL